MISACGRSSRGCWPRQEKVVADLELAFPEPETPALAEIATQSKPPEFTSRSARSIVIAATMRRAAASHVTGEKLALK